MFVYVIGIANRSGLVKIGYAQDPFSRLVDLQLHCPDRLVLAATIRCVSPAHARAVEAQTHALYAARKEVSEWFRLDDIEHVVAEVQQIAESIIPHIRTVAEVKKLKERGVLSPRESDVFRMYSTGMSCSQVAVELGLSVKTVSTHARRIREKLGLTDARALRHFAATKMRETPDFLSGAAARASVSRTMNGAAQRDQFLSDNATH
jgi:DNA-binding CsgD family transcriptional regulator